MKSCDVSSRFGPKNCPRPVRRWAGWVAAVLLILVSAGCGASVRTVIPLEERPFEKQVASRDELLEILGKGDAVQTIMSTAVTYTATGLGLTSGVQQTYRETTGLLLADRPSHIHIKGDFLLGLGTAFRMVSDGRTFRVWLPGENRLVEGSVDAPPTAETAIMNLRPQHILEALFVDIRAYMSDPNVDYVLEESTEGRQSFYVISFINFAEPNSQLLEKIWIDRLNLQVSRRQLFAKDGVIVTDVTYSEHRAHDGLFFPHRITVIRPVEDYELAMDFETIELNVPPQENAFVLEVPASAERVLVGDDPAD